MTAAPHLLVIRRRYIGDIVLLGSFLRNLRLHWPDARLTVLTEPAYAPVLALNPDVSAALALPRRTNRAGATQSTGVTQPSEPGGSSLVRRCRKGGVE